MLSFFRNRAFTAVVAGHFAIDSLNSLGPVLLAALAPALLLSNNQIGLAITLYTMFSSLSQPLFGWYADRARLSHAALAGIGVGWTALCFAGVAFAPSWALLLPCFLLAAFGSGLFHPIGTTSAARAGGERSASASSVFFFGGQVGLAVGPIVSGSLFASIGRLGVLPLSVFALLPVALLFSARTRPGQHAAARAQTPQTATKASLWAIAAFVVLVATRSSIQATYTAFLPKLFQDRGWNPATYGAIAGTFILAAAIGQLLTGELADRFGMRAVTVWPLLLSVPAGLVCLWAPSVAMAFAASALAGLLIGGQHSVLVVYAQRLMPAQQGLAAGLILGFIFATGGIGTWIAGASADVFSLLPVLQATTLLALPCAALALTLPGRAPTLAVVVPAAQAGD